jgi:N-acetylmuramoyl-L-alanine amidase
MKRILGSVLLALATTGVAVTSACAGQSLGVVYPPADHQTTAKQVFLIGTAPAGGDVLVNGKPIPRSASGNFAPSFPLKLGENQFVLRYQNQEIKLKVTRNSDDPPAPQGVTFGKDSLTPAIDIARLPGELICFSAVAPRPQGTTPSKAIVSVKLADQLIPLQLQTSLVNLPANSGVLTGLAQPITNTGSGQYAGCVKAEAAGELGQPQYLLTSNGASVAQTAPGKIKVLSPTQLEIVEVTAEQGTARTGPSTDYSRLTPLPKGTRATVTGQEGDWLRLDYGGWIKASETKGVPGAVPVKSLIRGITSREAGDWTELRFPLQTPVPVSIQQDDTAFNLTLYNTTAQTDTIRLVDNPVIAKVDWQQTEPDKLQYRISLKSAQQWGYKLRYEGTTLVLSLKHPPQLHRSNNIRSSTALAGIKILLDPGHGGPEDQGSKGPTGYPEKDAALLTSQLLRQELVKRGATVVMTRTADVDLDLPPRVAAINQTEPTIALSLHYNALPDEGDAINTKGVAAFWYQPQAYSLAEFMHDYLVKTLKRPSYGVFWNNLALTRPTVTPSVLLELGFMINPDEFEWISNRQEQQKLAIALADGITEWFRQRR